MLKEVSGAKELTEVHDDGVGAEAAGWCVEEIPKDKSPAVAAAEGWLEALYNT